MFYVTLKLKNQASVWGLSALDRNRELLLPDSTQLRVSERGSHVEVSEVFAREHSEDFREKEGSVLVIFLEDCIAGDVKVEDGYVLMEEISEYRIRELITNGYELS